ncbi:MAG TPA: LytS/YhcK type 5TM receptor domain-containing protein [Desulfomicrobiaceae bacterium]|nr:LytS/YhcK type 5TM receptor domain-containing protein [Desulfomicrobiaceae bacterium]
MITSIGLLIVTLIEHVGLIVAAAFILLSMAPVQPMMLERASLKHRLFLTLFFGIFGIMGTYGGNLIFDSFANLRAMAVITGGLYGGPLVGLGAGLIAGGHRFLIDIWGFSAFPCALATTLEGLAAGLIAVRLGQKRLNWQVAALTGVIGEGIHMLLVLGLSSSFDDALELVKVIALPMMLVNPLGAGLFIHIITMVFDAREKRESIQTKKIFDIANQTLTHLRSGLNPDSAQATARIIHNSLSVPAVAITNRDTVLAHIGAGDDHHLPGAPLRTTATRRVIETGQPLFITSRNAIGCNTPHCPCTSGIIIPLKKGEETIGTLKFYGTRETNLDAIGFEIGKGLGNLFSTQLELEDIQVQAQLLAHAEIRRLQAQINPHFLFNSLNTIASFCRTNSERARELILDLSVYMRRNLDSSRGLIPLKEELEQVDSFLAIVQARFGDRIQVCLDLERGLEDWPIPSLIIQPLVENAVKHGLAGLENGGTVTLRVSRDQDLLQVCVEDDGVGINRSRIRELFADTCPPPEGGGTGIGVRNCNNRLKRLYGPENRLAITSDPGRGTRISFAIPRSMTDPAVVQ